MRSPSRPFALQKPANRSAQQTGKARFSLPITGAGLDFLLKLQRRDAVGIGERFVFGAKFEVDFRPSRPGRAA
jgi:hypothetical protein